jgi:hypothetical protein
VPTGLGFIKRLSKPPTPAGRTDSEIRVTRRATVSAEPACARGGRASSSNHPPGTSRVEGHKSQWWEGWEKDLLLDLDWCHVAAVQAVDWLPPW